jgi:4-hydroxy-tetrahydrodipicolinate synthase
VRAVAAASGLPVVLDDVPSRARVAFADETVALLREAGAVHALKDAAADLSRPARERRLCGADLPQLSGDDAAAVATAALRVFLVAGRASGRRCRPGSWPRCR